MLTVVALHYWAGSGREYDLLRPHLPAGARLLAPDLPGFGERLAPAGFDYSVRAYADWLGEFVAENAGPDYVLVGHSLSGKVALAWAARRPAGLRRLVLLSPSPPTPEPIADADRAAMLAGYGEPEAAARTFAVITEHFLPAAVRAQVLADNLRTSHEGWEAWVTAGSKEDISALMPQVQAPCRLLVGAADRAITPETQRRETLPRLPAGTRLEVVPGAGHLLPLEAPAAVAKAITG